MKKQNLIFLMLCAITSSELVCRALAQPRSQDPSLKIQNNVLRNEMKAIPQMTVTPLDNKQPGTKLKGLSKKTNNIINKRDEWKKIGDNALFAAQKKTHSLIGMIDLQLSGFYLLSQRFLSDPEKFNHKSMDNLHYNLKSLQSIINVEMKKSMESGDSVQTAERLKVRANNLTKALQDYKIYKSAKGHFFKSSDIKNRAKLNCRTLNIAEHFDCETDYLNTAKQGKQNAKEIKKVMASNKAKRKKDKKSNKVNSASLNSSHSEIVPIQGASQNTAVRNNTAKKAPARGAARQNSAGSPGQGATRPNTSRKAPGQGSARRNTAGKAPGQGSARRNTAGKAPGQGSARRNTAGKSPVRGAARRNTAGKSPVIGAARRNTAGKSPVRGAARKNTAGKAQVSVTK